MRLKSKIVVITGAASGIGRSCAEVFAKEGAQVILTDINDPLGSKVASIIGPQAHYKHLDVSDEEQWRQLADDVIAQFGRLDVLVNNAGINGLGGHQGPQDPEHVSLESWEFIHKVNAISVFLGCREAIRIMKSKQCGSIINMSSRWGILGVPDMAPYASSKASIRNQTKTVAMYCATQGYNIRCNSIHPASITTPILEGMVDAEKGKKQLINDLAKRVPLGKMGKPEDIAYATSTCASDCFSKTVGVVGKLQGYHSLIPHLLLFAIT